MTPTPVSSPVHDVMRRKLVFVSGKGGVGKTSIAHALSLASARSGRRCLRVTFEDPTRPRRDLKPIGPNLWDLNCDAGDAFEEYATLKIGVGFLARVFVGNELVRYLAKAAPGIHELVLLGKVWNERLHYDQVVVDMPSTGYGVTMFQSTANFVSLFHGGPIHRDAEAMLETFGDPGVTGHLIVGLPEEMPLQEGLELAGLLGERFPKNAPGFLLNKRFPGRLPQEVLESSPPDSWKSPIPENTADYARKRQIREASNLELWREAGVGYEELPFLAQCSTEEIATLLEPVLSDSAKRAAQ